MFCGEESGGFEHLDEALSGFWIFSGALGGRERESGAAEAEKLDVGRVWDDESRGRRFGACGLEAKGSVRDCKVVGQLVVVIQRVFDHK